MLKKFGKNLRNPLTLFLKPQLSLNSRLAATQYFNHGLYTTNFRYFSSNPEVVVDEQTIEKKDSKNYEFKAETKKILDIMAKSIYTEKDVFIRELLSNSSDSLEKQRFLMLSNQVEVENHELQVSIIAHPEKRQFIIQDSGIGMSKEDLIEALGTIAKSGSQEFLAKIAKSEENSASNLTSNIIGQFGVGFYSVFTVADTVEVYSRTGEDQDTHLWVSDGSGTFELSKIKSTSALRRGTKIVLYLKPECNEFCNVDNIKKIVNRYSNFINYPILLNGEKLNLVSAIWTKSKRDVTEEEYTNFYQYITNSKSTYKYKLHVQVDVPFAINALLFIPAAHGEKLGMSQEEMEVSLYSRKVLIKPKCRELLPSYLRFMKGVVDCEDISLNISRESFQESQKMDKICKMLTKKIISMLSDEAKNRPEAYESWFSEFHHFLKEGIVHDHENTDNLYGLMRYNANYTYSSVSLDDYISKLKSDQKKIYYIFGPTRDALETSPYLEPFKGTDIPILYVYSQLDEFVFQGMKKYKEYEFMSVETNFTEISKNIKVDNDTTKGVPEDDVTTFCLWLKNELAPKINTVQISKRLKDSPCILLSQLSSGMRQALQMMDQDQAREANKSLTLEINSNHTLIVKINQLRKEDPTLAALMAKQLLDNLLLTNGMLTDSKTFLNRIHKLMIFAMDGRTNSSSQQEEAKRPEEKTQEEESFNAESILKEAFHNVNKSKIESMDTEIEIGPDGKPKIK